MDKKRLWILAALFGALVALACGVTINLPEDAIQVGPVVTNDINIAVPKSGDPAKVKLNFGTGSLKIRPANIDGLIAGKASYNVKELKPSITTSGDDVKIESGTFDYELTGLPNFTEIENKWELKFGTYPMTLNLRAGAFKGDLDLGGLSLKNLEILSGASSVNVDFSEPNLVSMNAINISTGASTMKLHHLANANFSLFEFKGGGGTYVFDFSGSLQRDASVQVDVGLGTVEIIVPKGVPAKVTVNGQLNTVNTSGKWQGDGNKYSQPGSGSSLDISITANAGTLSLSNP